MTNLHSSNDFFEATTCVRCRKSLGGVSIMSKFNTDVICLACKEREKKHPKYAEADAAEIAAVRSGNYNFPGIGCPPDLYSPEVKP